MIIIVLQTISQINIRQSASKTASVVCTVPANTDVEIVGVKIIWKDNIPFVKISYKGKRGFTNGRYLRGLVLKVKNRDSAKYPKLVVIASGRASRRIKIPQQIKFGAFCQKHGCSMAAATIALQFRGILKSPAEVHQYAKKHLGGYTGSKLTIFGIEKAVNKIAGKKISTWKGCPVDANKRIRNNIQKAIHDGHIVLLEQKNPIHTNVIIGRSVDGKYVVATNGTTKKVTMNWLIKTVLHGKAGRKNQANWWKGTARGAGYVIVKRA